MRICPVNLAFRLCMRAAFVIRSFCVTSVLSTSPLLSFVLFHSSSFLNYKSRVIKHCHRHKVSHDLRIDSQLQKKPLSWPTSSISTSTPSPTRTDKGPTPTFCYPSIPLSYPIHIRIPILFHAHTLLSIAFLVNTKKRPAVQEEQDAIQAPRKKRSRNRWLPVCLCLCLCLRNSLSPHLCFGSVLSPALWCDLIGDIS